VIPPKARSARPAPESGHEEVAALIDTLRATSRRLEALTGSEVDSMVDREGRTFLLQTAQEHLRIHEAAKQAALLNALPTHIALLNAEGVIVSVNDAWRRFASAGTAQAAGHAVGVNYLGICDAARGDGSSQAHLAAMGVRAVLAGTADNFSIEYPCHSPRLERWFMMTVSPLVRAQPRGAVVMHVDITESKRNEEQSSRFVAAMESVADAIYLIDRSSMSLVHVNDAACRMQGRTRDEVLASRPEDLLSVPRAELERTYDAIIASGQAALPVEILRVRPDGSPVWVEIRRHAQCTGERWLIVTLVRDITVRKEIDRRLKRLNRVHAVLSGINSLIVRDPAYDELLDEACRIAVGEGELRMAWIGLVDEPNGLLQPRAWAGDVRDFFTAAPRDVVESRPGGFGIAGRALQAMKPMVSNDTLNDHAIFMKTAFGERGIKSLASIPLIVGQHAIGVLSLYSHEVGFFNAEEMHLLMEVAGNISLALENMEKEEKVRRLTRVHTVLSRINSLIMRVTDRDQLLREASRIVIDDGGFIMAWIAMMNKTTGVLEAVASAGPIGDFFKTLPLTHAHNQAGGPGLMGRAVRELKVTISNDVGRDPGILRKAEHAQRGINSAAHIPLIVAGVAIGVLALYSADADFFDEEEIELLRELGGDISNAIDHLDKRQRLDYLAYYDALTGLPNRRLFLGRVEQGMLKAASGGHKIALVLIDLERFKNINDALGRPAGDALLTQVAQWLRLKAGDAELVAHLGADHFAVVLPRVTSEGVVVRLLERTMRAFLDHSFSLNDGVYRFAAKVGVSIYPQDGANADTLLKNAEAALKRAKASGERLVLYKPTMAEMTAGRLTLETQLRQALDKNEFVLHYQPKVNLASGKLTGAEGLIRWNDPRTGLVPPGRFIPVLEETGLIHDVGRWALHQAIADYLRWRAAGLAAVRIAVNVSPLQLRSRGFVAEIRKAVGVHAHAPAGLEVEITESLIMEDVKHSTASLQAVRALGVTVAIDDFGTGFSSLSYLAKLPVDTVKVDRSFVSDMAGAPEGLALVSTIIGLAHSLRLKVVAEGVETEEQSRLLRLLDCDEMQGFLLSKAVPTETFETRFLAGTPAQPR
jgi:diguanylate cyclase (GGDEF)-like protein/PAS domain S-box-containing protein